MRENKKVIVNEVESETKTRIPVWLYPSALEVVDQMVERGNWKSRSEYLEKAALFYAGYLSGEDAAAFLPQALVSAIRGTLQDSENRTSRLLFKLAVEVDMMMHLFATAMEIEPEILEKLRALCVKEIKKTNGSISLKDVVEYQKGADR